jgi:hypothetical protein
LRWPAVLVLS